MTDFFRFPHTSHIAWLGEGQPRDDKVLAPHEVEELLADVVLVEEKIDGANLGLSIATDGTLVAQNRGQYLSAPYTGQFSRLASWLAQHEWALAEKLDSELILFGEWCAAKHSLDYANLPDLLVMFDVYDRCEQRFWSSKRRNALAAELGLAVVASVYEGSTSLPALKKILATSASHYRDGPPEGLVVRRESTDWCEARAKLVRAEFTQTISEHWRSRVIEWNRVALNKGKPT